MWKWAKSQLKINTSNNETSEVRVAWDAFIDWKGCRRFIWLGIGPAFKPEAGRSGAEREPASPAAGLESRGCCCASGGQDACVYVCVSAKGQADTGAACRGLRGPSRWMHIEQKSKQKGLSRWKEAKDYLSPLLQQRNKGLIPKHPQTIYYTTIIVHIFSYQCFKGATNNTCRFHYIYHKYVLYGHKYNYGMLNY